MTLGYKEVGSRLYEVVLVHGPIPENGREYLCFLAHSTQQVKISDRVRECDREACVDRAVEMTNHRLAEIQPVPLLPVPLLQVGD